MAVDGITGTSSGSSLDQNRRTIADNFDTFLQILTTQLKNQNPLDPMDTNQFTQQLVQFTSVEQQLKTNEFLEALMMANEASVNTDAVSYIGKEVTTAGDRADLAEGQAVWGYSAEADAHDAVVTIKDGNGSVVYSERGQLAAGEGQFVWDGVGSDGNPKPAGTYTITIEAKDLSGRSVPVTTASNGIVSAVDFSGGEPVLTIGNAQVKLSDVTNVRIPETKAPPPAPSADPDAADPA
ncbi:flagellar hook assembly protein [Devosia pacifica]|uniref:Basal-body rod modification protein FlgD n=1 Tax=Devosia pacifica TaxID=1335967 RepID=A0A918S853_9HYPH|nr:flagellar hook assembly protein FlgD [Devosia pacifica]GHA28206.1 flagellar hook assembly protein [Devosia pacifica]